MSDASPAERLERSQWDPVGLPGDSAGLYAQRDTSAAVVAQLGFERVGEAHYYRRPRPRVASS